MYDVTRHRSLSETVPATYAEVDLWKPQWGVGRTSSLTLFVLSGTLESCLSGGIASYFPLCLPLSARAAELFVFVWDGSFGIFAVWILQKSKDGRDVCK